MMFLRALVTGDAAPNLTRPRVHESATEQHGAQLPDVRCVAVDSWRAHVRVTPT
jgi:hypothetical protein